MCFFKAVIGSQAAKKQSGSVIPERMVRCLWLFQPIKCMPYPLFHVLLVAAATKEIFNN